MAGIRGCNGKTRRRGIERFCAQQWIIVASDGLCYCYYHNPDDPKKFGERLGEIMEKNSGELEWGLLWLDNDPQKARNQKIIEAATRYRQKHGQRPNLCRVHPSEVEGICGMVDGVSIVADATVLKHHYWIGVSKEKNENHD